MAGDWIKMRGNLWDDPRVSALVDATDSSEAAIVGGLYWLWATADQHTENGFMPGLTLRQIDRKTGVLGFAQALCDIGWLTVADDGVTIENFTDHNGTSAKRRGMEAQRKANVRKVSADDADKPKKSGGQIPPKPGAREEKRREEISVPIGTGGTPPSPQEQVWANGIPLLTAAGVKESNARSMLGGLCKTHGPEAVADAIQRCAEQGALAPVAWLQAALKAKPSQNKQEALEQRNSAIGQQWAAQGEIIETH